MIQSQDLELLQNMLSTDQFPDSFVIEYELRLRMLHLCGQNGGLGPLGLIDLCREFRLEPKAMVGAVAAEIDWRAVEVGAPVLVEHPNGTIEPGVYCGQVSSGTVSVRHSDSDWLTEYRAGTVKLADVEKTVDAEGVKESLAGSDPVCAKADAMNTDADCGSGAVKWSIVPAGTPVAVVAGDDLISGEFISLADQKGCLAVMVGGSRTVMDAGDVILDKLEPEAGDEPAAEELAEVTKED